MAAAATASPTWTWTTMTTGRQEAWTPVCCMAIHRMPLTPLHSASSSSRSRCCANASGCCSSWSRRRPSHTGVHRRHRRRCRRRHQRQPLLTRIPAVALRRRWTWRTARLTSRRWRRRPQWRRRQVTGGWAPRRRASPHLTGTTRRPAQIRSCCPPPLQVRVLWSWSCWTRRVGRGLERWCQGQQQQGRRAAVPPAVSRER